MFKRLSMKQFYCAQALSIREYRQKKTAARQGPGDGKKFALISAR
jgi:hypothetical protein